MKTRVDTAGFLAAGRLRSTPKSCADFWRAWLEIAAFRKRAGVLTMPGPDMSQLYTEEFLPVISRYLRYTAGIQLTRERQVGGQAE